MNTLNPLSKKYRAVQLLMIRRNIILAAWICCFGFHSAKASEPVCKFPSNQAVTLTGKESKRLADQCSRLGVEGVTSIWTPTATEIADLEKRLCMYLKQAHPNVCKRLSRSYFQYAGFMAHGKRLIYVDAFNETATIDPRDGSRNAWRTQAISVCDGGSIFWGVEFSPDTKQFSNISFNGPT